MNEDCPLMNYLILGCFDPLLVYGYPDEAKYSLVGVVA